MVGNLSYENTPYETNEIVVGHATLKLCGSFGKSIEEYKKNSLNEEVINEISTDIALFLMQLINKKKEANELGEENLLILDKKIN